MLARIGRFIGINELQFLDEENTSIIGEGYEESELFEPFKQLIRLF